VEALKTSNPLAVSRRWTSAWMSASSSTIKIELINIRLFRVLPVLRRGYPSFIYH